MRRRSTRQGARQEQLLLSPAQEDVLKIRILDLEATGYPLSHGRIHEMAGLISKSSGGTEACGVHWIQRFLRRHPDIRSKVSCMIDHQRVKNTTLEALQTWFDRFEAIRQQFNAKTENIWNMDETGLALGHYKN